MEIMPRENLNLGSGAFSSGSSLALRCIKAATGGSNLKKEFGQTLDEDEIADEAPVVADDGPSDSYSQIEEESAIKSRVAHVHVISYRTTPGRAWSTF